ncbi:MAG: YggT family protein [Clostridiales bacterium]|nr:YggT family protein [Clostridiales bacterium]
MHLLTTAIDGFAQIIMLLLLGRAIVSWFARPGGSAYKLYQVLIMLTEPIVAPCRAVTSRLRTGMMDFSVLLAMLLVIMARGLLIGLIDIFIH